MKNDTLLEEENEMTPSTPVIQPNTNRDHKDENEYLFGADDLSDEEMEEPEDDDEED